MATDIFTPVALIENLHAHPDAEKLECCFVLGWPVCVQKGVFKEGQKVIYVASDSIVPDIWAQKWGVKAYLKGANQDRCGKIKLRGEPSFGFIVPLQEGEDWEVGTNLADHFGITKYEPPIRTSCGDADKEISLCQRYTDVDNLRNHPNAFTEGEEIIATEKIHGTNCRLFIIEGIEGAASMSFPRKRPSRLVGDDPATQTVVPCEFSDPMLIANHYWFPWSLEPVRDLLYGLHGETKSNQIILYGEVFGPIQKGHHYGSAGKLQFMAFDLLIDGRYLNYDDFKAMCDKYGVQTCPVIYRGPYSIAKIREVSGGRSTLDKNTVREGVVVCPPVERQERRVGRLKMKYVSDDYLFGVQDDSKDV